jgi:hypothetical protein
MPAMRLGSGGGAWICEPNLVSTPCHFNPYVKFSFIRLADSFRLQLSRRSFDRPRLIEIFKAIARVPPFVPFSGFAKSATFRALHRKSSDSSKHEAVQFLKLPGRIPDSKIVSPSPYHRIQFMNYHLRRKPIAGTIRRRSNAIADRIHGSMRWPEIWDQFARPP